MKVKDLISTLQRYPDTMDVMMVDYKWFRPAAFESEVVIDMRYYNGTKVIVIEQFNLNE